MRNNPGKKAVLILILALLLTPLFWLQGTSAVMAASPSLKEDNIEIIGVGETYQLDIVNKVDGSKYKWSSSNTKVARVSSKGLVTSAGKGSATIRCVITYPNKKTKTLKCKVTVVIPATKITINNANPVNGAHILKVGESYNFNRDIYPSNSSDKTYWLISQGDPNCVKVNSSNGIVQALKPGYVVLRAAAVRTATEEEALKSIIDDAVIIRIVEPSASVTYAEIIDSTQLKVIFDSPIDASTVIGTNNKLLDSIVITLSNIKGVMASDPGNLTAQLSEDKKTLTITASNRFEGEYGISFTSNIKTTDGIALTEYYKLMKYADTIPPEIKECVVDDTGMVMSIVFSEPIDFTNLKVSNVAVVAVTGGQSSTSIDPVTAGILSNKNNYIASEDKRSLTINLSNIAYTDYNKIFSVAISGIKDLSGNAPASSYLTAYLRTDTSPKPQAKLISIARTGYYTLTAIFDRALKTGGYVIVQNGSSYAGIVDEKDPKKVNFTMNEADALKTGYQTVILSGWNSYNVDPKDTASYQQHQRTVNFTVDQTNPVLLKEEYDAQTGILTLTYNKEVTLSSKTGTFIARLVTINDEIRPNNNITYTQLSTNDPKVIKLQLGNMTYYGYYTFTLDKFFVMDTFKNYGLERTITISNFDGANLELPGPYKIAQSDTNPSEIYLEFANMLDVASAQNVSNYIIPGVTILNAKVVKNTKNEGATVVLTIADGSIEISLERPIKINGIKSYSGIYGPISDFSTTVYLRDNKKPYYVSTIFDKSKPNEIRLRFSENITGTMYVRVINQSSYSYEIGNTVTVSGTDVIITLNSVPERNSLLRIEIIENKITDSSGNETMPMNTQLFVNASY